MTNRHAPIFHNIRPSNHRAKVQKISDCAKQKPHSLPKSSEFIVVENVAKHIFHQEMKINLDSGRFCIIFVSDFGCASSRRDSVSSGKSSKQRPVRDRLAIAPRQTTDRQTTRASQKQKDAQKSLRILFVSYNHPVTIHQRLQR